MLKVVACELSAVLLLPIGSASQPGEVIYVCSLVVNGLAARRLARAGEREARRAGAEKEIAVAACSGLFRSPAPLLILRYR